MERTMQNLTMTKLEAEIIKLVAESKKIDTERKWYPWVAVAAIFGAALAAAKYFVS